jgi:hypothetical protein
MYILLENSILVQTQIRLLDRTWNIVEEGIPSQRGRCGRRLSVVSLRAAVVGHFRGSNVANNNARK